MTDLITDHMDIWTDAQIQKANGGRGRGKNGNGQPIYGIKKLRELILELAVRGKLVPQDPDDEPASVLLEKIAEERKRLIKEGKIKKQKELPEIGEDEKPFELPEGWEWQRLGNIATFENGDRSNRYPKSKNLKPSGIPFFGAKDMVDGELRFDNDLRFISNSKFLELRNGKLCDKDFVLLLRGTVGKIAIFRANDKFSTGFINAQMVILRMLNREFCDFFRLYSTSNFFQSLVTNKTTGSAIRQMPANALFNFLLPLPPLLEQHRIVAKVDELMALCDQLEKQQTDNNATHQNLVETLLTTLTTAADPKDFDESWQRIVNHFDTLFTTEQSIDHLKQTILQLAVMGRLVPQDPDDEPASVLLEKIAKEKARLVKEGKITKQKRLPEISEDDKSFGLPDKWSWEKLSDLLAIITDGDHQPPPKSDTGIPFLVIGNLNTGNIVFENYKYTIEDYYQSLNWSRKPILGDLLYTVTGSYGIPIAVDTDRSFCVQRHVAILKSTPSTPKKFLSLFLSSRCAFDFSTKIATGIAQKTVPLTGLRKMPVPLPPKNEQNRIVAKVDELLTICDTLKARLNDAQTTQVQLADAIVEQAVA